MQPVPDYGLSVVEQLRAMTEAGTLQPDRYQFGVAEKLDRILTELKARKPAAKKSALGWMFARARKPEIPIKGLYIHGSVGRGKTMLMDLFFRLAGAHVALPPLRTRRDRAALIEAVLGELAGDRPIADRTRAVATLAAAPWPGNLHELRSIISLVLATGDDEALEPVFREFVAAEEDAVRPLAGDFGRHPSSGSGPIVEQAIDDLEQLLVANHWCVSRVARLLGVDRSTIHRRMNRFNLVPPQRRA